MNPAKDAILETIAFNIDSPDGARPPVIRNYALSVPAFDFFKRFQRETESELGIHLTNGQALEALLGAYASLRFATEGNPEWDFSESLEFAQEAAIRNGSAVEIPLSKQRVRVMRTEEAMAGVRERVEARGHRPAY